MKKLFCLLLTAALALSLAACGPRQESAEPAPPEETAAAPAPSQPEETTPPAPTPPEETAAQPAGPFAPEGSVIYEKGGVKVTTAGLDEDPTTTDPRPILWIDIENTGNREVYLGVSRGAFNGVMADIFVNEYIEEDGEVIGSREEFGALVPAGETLRRSLSWSLPEAPGLYADAFGELELYFTLGEDEFAEPEDVSAAVVVTTGEHYDLPDITALGTVAVDNDVMTLVLGDQDYSDWFGPQVYVYVQNKSDRFLGVFPESSETDGVPSEYLLGGFHILPGKLDAGWICFEGEAQALKGFENLSMTFSVGQSDNVLGLDSLETAALAPVSRQYPPQVWGTYENGGLRLEIQPKYNELITVETPENDENGVLFSVSETASLEAGDFEGAGWLFSVCKVGEEKLHELLCSDMSGVEVFARDEEWNHYLFCRPTDVRYARADGKEMERDQGTWTMLNRWAEDVKDQVREANGLTYESFGNSLPEMLVARAAWEKDADCYLATTEFMDVGAKAADGTLYAEYVLGGGFWEIQPEELPDPDYLTGENLVLSFPGEGLYLHFYPVDGGYVILDNGESETIYQTWWTDENVDYYEAMHGWYYAAAEKTGLRIADESLAAFLGQWHEEIAGRGSMSITPSLAPGKVKLDVEWANSAAEYYAWTMTASLTEEGKLVYENGSLEIIDTDEDGVSWINDSESGLAGELYFDEEGKLLWYDDNAEGGRLSTFVR